MTKNSEELQYQKDLKEYRSRLSEQAYLSARELDNGITIVATGALVVSIGLLDHFSSVCDMVVVGLSWVFLLLTLGTHLFSHWLSNKSLNKQIDLVDQGVPSEENVWTKAVNFSNLAARIFLVVGIALLSVYAFGNLKISTNQEGPTTQSCICKK